MIKAKIDFLDVVNQMEKFKASELPYAISLGLNDTAFDVKDHSSKQMSKKFDLKSKHPQRGYRVKKANKNNLVGEVYHLDNYLAKQEFGELQRPSGNKRLTKTKKFRGRSPRIPVRKYASVLLKDYKGPEEAGKKGGRGNKGKGRTKFFRFENNIYAFIARRKNRSKKRFNEGNAEYAYREVRRKMFKARLDFNKEAIERVKRVGVIKIANQINRLG
jgi:hypothetical protein